MGLPSRWWSDHCPASPPGPESVPVLGRRDPDAAVKGPPEHLGAGEPHGRGHRVQRRRAVLEQIARAPHAAPRRTRPASGRPPWGSPAAASRYTFAVMALLAAGVAGTGALMVPEHIGVLAGTLA